MTIDNAMDTKCTRVPNKPRPTVKTVQQTYNIFKMYSYSLHKLVNAES